MKIKLISLLLVIAFFSSCKEEKLEITFSLSNELEIARADAQITISYSKLDEISSVKKENEYLVLKNEAGEIVPFQIDTLNEENIEIAFVLNFEAKQTQKVTFSLSEKRELFPATTNIYLGKDANFDSTFVEIQAEQRDTAHKPQSFPVLYQAEGISMENDLIGYRTYWDSRNAKDVWGKLKPELVMDSVGLPNTQSYHVMADWGMDILHVGGSLGAGAIAMFENDSLYRLGETEKASMKVIAEGCVRAILELKYEGWIVNGKSYTLTEKITLWEGSYGYKSELFLEGGDENSVLVSGIVNSYTDTSFTVKENNMNILYTHAKQSESKDILGLALLISNNLFISSGETARKGTGVTETYYSKFKATKDAEFYFFAGWEAANSKFSTKEGFEKFLIEEAMNLRNPITVMD